MKQTFGTERSFSRAV